MDKRFEDLPPIEGLPKLKKEIDIKGYKLILTCWACPEQYDVFHGKKQVGYIRLRHGAFRVDYLKCGGDTIVREELPKENGQFSTDEVRLFYLTKAIDAIKEKEKNA
jgi:hypothetical protein